MVGERQAQKKELPLSNLSTYLKLPFILIVLNLVIVVFSTILLIYNLDQLRDAFGNCSEWGSPSDFILNVTFSKKLFLIPILKTLISSPSNYLVHYSAYFLSQFLSLALISLFICLYQFQGPQMYNSPLYPCCIGQGLGICGQLGSYLWLDR